VLLLDEPLSNLDPALREDLRDQIRTIVRDLNMTTVFVTHDQQEALSLADTVVIMEAGICKQMGAPADIYSHPADAFVARFLGKANVLPGACVGLPDDVQIVVRPENIRFAAAGRQATVVKTSFEGAIVNYILDAGGIQITARQFHHGNPTRQPGDAVYFEIPPDGFHRIPKS
jgi:ABC-type Fe3+/spermidine/putrescine transport system ATPase subunit